MLKIRTSLTTTTTAVENTGTKTDNIIKTPRTRTIRQLKQQNDNNIRNFYTFEKLRKENNSRNQNKKIQNISKKN